MGSGSPSPIISPLNLLAYLTCELWGAPYTQPCKPQGFLGCSTDKVVGPREAGSSHAPSSCAAAFRNRYWLRVGLVGQDPQRAGPKFQLLSP